MFQFAYPSALSWLWLLPLVVAINFFLERRKQRLLRKHFGQRLTPFLSASLSSRKRWVKTGLETVALLFFVLALARPQFGERSQEIKSEGIEILFLIDVSNSMRAEDVRPNRLEHAKNELGRLIDMLGGDKAGVVAFAGSAVLLSPMTTDKSALRMFVESLTTDSVSTQGTNLSEALEEAEQALQRGGVESDETTRVTKAVVVVSDGEAHEQGALDQAKKMASDGMRIFTLAFGTQEGAPIPVYDRHGRQRGYKRDDQGKIVMSQVQGDFLRALAQAGQGSFYHVDFAGEQMNSLKKDIDRLEKTQFESQTATSYDEKYQFFVFLGLLCLLMELFLVERRKKGRVWMGRFEVPQS